MYRQNPVDLVTMAWVRLDQPDKQDVVDSYPQVDALGKYVKYDPKRPRNEPDVAFSLLVLDLKQKGVVRDSFVDGLAAVSTAF